MVCVPQLCLLYTLKEILYLIFILSGLQVVCNIKQISILPKYMVIELNLAKAKQTLMQYRGRIFCVCGRKLNVREDQKYTASFSKLLL